MSYAEDTNYDGWDLDVEDFEEDYLQFLNIVHTTNKAILFHTPNGNCWIPKSVIKEYYIKLPSNFKINYFYKPK